MNLFTRLPISVPDPGLPVLHFSEIARLKNEFELDAYDHWIFDSGDTAALTGRVNGKVLTTIGGPHTYNENSVAINVTSGKALQSDYIATRKQTMIAVVRPNTAAATMVIAGTRGPTAGSMLYFGSTLTKVSADQRSSAFLTELVRPLEVGNYYFCALSENDAPGTMTDIVYASGSTTTHTGGTLKTLATAGLALGNLQNGNATGAILNFAEFLIYDRALSVAELDDVYARSQQRMADRGITLV